MFIIASLIVLCSCVVPANNLHDFDAGKQISVQPDKKQEKYSSHDETLSKEEKVPYKHDVYKSVAEIRANHKEGTDFRIKYMLRKSSVAVFAIHGGKLEQGTSAIAKAVAGKDYSFYLFEVLLKNPHRLHITAANFDDPAALEIAESSIFGLSMHVEKEKGDMICVGGGNLDAAKMMSDMLISEGYPVEYPCKRLPGKSPKNIVNRTKLGGVQFEFTRSQIQKIVSDREVLRDFAEKIRKTSEKYLHSVSEDVKK